MDDRLRAPTYYAGRIRASAEADPDEVADAINALDKKIDALDEQIRRLQFLISGDADRKLPSIHEDIAHVKADLIALRSEHAKMRVELGAQIEKGAPVPLWGLALIALFAFLILVLIGVVAWNTATFLNISQSLP